MTGTAAQMMTTTRLRCPVAKKRSIRTEPPWAPQCQQQAGASSRRRRPPGRRRSSTATVPHGMSRRMAGAAGAAAPLAASSQPALKGNRPLSSSGRLPPHPAQPRRSSAAAAQYGGCRMCHLACKCLRTGGVCCSSSTRSRRAQPTGAPWWLPQQRRATCLWRWSPPVAAGPRLPLPWLPARRVISPMSSVAAHTTTAPCSALRLTS